MSRLAAGHYRVEAKVGPAAARAFALDVVEPEPLTHFTNLLNLKYSSLGQGADYVRVVQSGEGAQQLVDWIAGLGYNAVMGMNESVNRVVRPGGDVEQLVRERPELGPWESYFHPSGRDQFMSAMLRRNMRFYEDMFTYNDTMMPREPGALDASERYVSLEVASMRHNPAFKGVSLYDEFYNSGDNSSPPAVVNLHYAAQEMAYRARYEKQGYTSARAAKAFDRFVSRPVGQRDFGDLTMFRTWPAHEDSEWAAFSSRMGGAARRVMPDSFNFTLARYFGHNGGNIAVNGTPSDVFRDLDAAVCVMYKDGGAGDRPVFAPMQANVLRVRDDIPVWTQLHTWYSGNLHGMHVVRQAFFGLQEKVEGFSYFTLTHPLENPFPTDDHQTLKNIIGGVTNPYGDFFLSLDKGYSEIGIYYSRQADYLAQRKPNSIPTMCEGIWVACMRAGFPAQFITDEQLLSGKGDRFKVIFVPGIVFEDETPPDILKALQKLVDAGKTVIVEKPSKLPIEQIVRVDSELDEYDDKLGGAFPRYEDFETEAVLDHSEVMTKLMRQLLPKYAQPATESTMLFSPNWLKKGSGHYMVLANFAPTKFTGLYKTRYQAPDVPTIRFPKRAVTAAYDALEMRRVELKSDGDWMSITADLRDYPGKIFALLPAPIENVALQATPAVAGGQTLQFVVSVLDAKDQRIDASFPIEVILSDPAGKEVYRVNRAAAPEFRGAYPIAANAATGAWSLKVRELLSGCAAESVVTVTQAGLPAGQLDARDVWVRDGAQIKIFLSDKSPATILIEPDQKWVLPQAQRLADALSKAGKPTRVATSDQVLRIPADWNPELPVLDGSRLWRGDMVQPGLLVDGPVILLGKRLESRLIEGITRRDALVESLSTNFPGPGRAIVAWAPRGFSPHADTLLVMAQDEGGLARGIDRLLSSDYASEVAIRQVLWPTPDAKGLLAAGKVAERAPTSFRKSATLLDTALTVDVDPETGRTLVGTFGYGHNLFCFDAAGKLLWKQFLPEHHVYLARWYDGGKRVLAATARGPWIFMLDPADGKVVCKFVASEWPDGHGYDGFWEGQTSTTLQIEINKALSQILIAGRTGLLAVDFDGKKMWARDRAEAITAYPPATEQSAAASFNKSLTIGDFAISPDGTKVAHGESVLVGSTPGQARGTVVDLWAYRPMILDARTGAVIAQNDSDPGSKPGWQMSWPADSAEPRVRYPSGAGAAVFSSLSIDGKLGPPQVSNDGIAVPQGQMLTLATRSASLWDANKVLWTIDDGHAFLRDLDQLSFDKAKLYRCDIDGLIRCVEIATGKTAWEHKASNNGMMSAVPNGHLVIATIDGHVLRLDATGKLLWETSILDLHERPARDYAAYVKSAVLRDVDSTGELYPISHDSAGDYDGLIKMGIEQLTNSSFESLEGWTSADGEIRTDATAKDGAKSLVLTAQQLVTQRLNKRIIPLGTYLLEFWYLCPDEATTLTAGAMLTGEKDKSALTASKFTGRPGQWTFGRLAVKALNDTRTIDIGFQSEGGAARVDLTSFRAVRFPSANLLANAELQAIEPTFVSDIRVQYDRIPGAVRDRLMGKNHVAVYRQGPSNTANIYAQEQAFLHNGRLDDLGPYWFEPPDPVGLSAVLAKPAWVSHVVIYLNNATPENTYRFISVLANNMETRLPEQAALVRGNDRRFVVVKFAKPIFTDSIKVLPGLHGGHKECLTEMELYGPLGGPGEAVAGFPKEDGSHPMYMGGPTHVSPPFAADLSGEFARVHRAEQPVAYNSGPTASSQYFTFGVASGAVGSVLMPAPGALKPEFREGPRWTLASVAPITTPAHYGGRMLVGSADYQLHAVSDQGAQLWTFKTGGRVYSSPLPSGDDVFFGSDDGRLYKVDIHSGMLLWEFATGDRIRSSPAIENGLIYFASWEGFLYAVNAESGQLAWKSPLAKFTRASPAVVKDRVYIGDEAGQMHCFDALSGSHLWNAQLGGYLSGCPLVSEEGILFLNEEGDAAMLSPQGEPRWKVSLAQR